MKQKIYLATNNGDIGGGEVMLLNIARAARSTGRQVTVVAPTYPGDLLEAAKDEGFTTVTLPATSRVQYMLQLRRWWASQKANTEGILWCNGLVPTVSTTGLRGRLVHLHQIPKGKNSLLARVASSGAKQILVPSKFASQRVAHARYFYNWVQPVEFSLPRSRFESDVVKVGFLGRPSPIKGTDLLAEAIYQLNERNSGVTYKLVLAGEAKYIDQAAQNSIESAMSKVDAVTQRLGWVEPSELLGAVDLLVVPSNWDEVFGLVAAEAMSASVPLVVSNAGALPEVVGEEYPWVAEQGSVKSLIQNIDDLVTTGRKNPQRLAREVQNLFWRWQERFSPAAGKGRLEELMSELERSHIHG
ncbi:glycosyltransferase family 4 protein [Rothia nasimurium]|uniref:glycosyltransferase family 4 protein n=1 Tax=Rothia nasimurium TaxID=85336 RepID=UPI001C8A7DF2|nr:glycosyltransferase family 4 protein [Rothia nasimurium]